jgi:CRP/FNR family transcriptional regulator, nitrogen oxide reductase regulator
MTAMTAGRRQAPLRSCAAPHHCPRPVRLDVLGHARYLRGLPPAELDDVDARMQVRGYEAEGAIYRAGEPATRLYVLATGTVKLLRGTPDGSDVLIDVLAPGDSFGTLSSLGDPTYPDTAQALSVACALSITAEDFRSVVQRHPSVALAVLDDLAHRLERSHQRVTHMSAGSVEQRVAAALLRLVTVVGEPRDGAVLLQLPLTRADLASMAGTTTESASRVMSRLRRDGMVESGRRWTSVRDVPRLRALAQA